MAPQQRRRVHACALAIKYRGKNKMQTTKKEYSPVWKYQKMCFRFMFAQSKNRIFTIFLGDSHRRQKDKRVGDRKGIKASTAGYVALCQWTRCWNVGRTLGSVTQNNQHTGSLPSNRLTAQREKGYRPSVMALCLMENDNTHP